MKDTRRILALAGSIMAFHVGSGFASGQEILQFYTAYGPRGGACMGLLAYGLFALFGFCLLETGRLHRGMDTLQQYTLLAGGAVGRLFYWVTPLLMALVLCVTVAGGGAALQTLFGLPARTGRLLIGLPVLLTVWLGLRWITALAGSIGPLIIACALALGAFGVWQGRDTQLWQLLPHAAGHWALAAVSYACFGTVTQVPFLLTVGGGLHSRAASAAVALLGNGGYMLTGTLLHLGLCRSLPQVISEQLPALRLAGLLSPLAGWFYGVVVLFSIYTTAVPLLWSVCRAVQPDEKGFFYRAAAFGLCALAAVGSQLPFDRLLGMLYPYIGYLSVAFFAVMLMLAARRLPTSSTRSGHSAARAACVRQTSRRAQRACAR